MFNNNITKDPTTPQVCRYTTYVQHSDNNRTVMHVCVVLLC